jgi:YVTN family beta-propeller protein
VIRKRLVRTGGVCTAIAVTVIVSGPSPSQVAAARPRPAASVSRPVSRPVRAAPVAAVVSAASAASKAPDRSAVGYDAYVALGSGNEVVRVDAATGRVTGTITDNAGEGVAVTASSLYIADTGQYDVLAHDLRTGRTTHIVVGPYPQTVTVSPTGNVVYATVTGSDLVAVISTATNTVIARVTVGTAPRQVVFSPDGEYAYVTTQDGIDVIDVATSSVVRGFRRPGPQGIAVGLAGKALYVTYPSADSVRKLNATTGATLAVTRTGAEPYAIAAAGPSLYVADTNDDTVSVISAGTGTVTRTIGVGRLPMSVAATPNGKQVWVGNGLSGTVSVISVPSGKVVATITGWPGRPPLDTAPLAIAFAKPSALAPRSALVPRPAPAEVNSVTADTRGAVPAAARCPRRAVVAPRVPLWCPVAHRHHRGQVAAR